MLVSLHKSYFYLLRAAKELNALLAGHFVEDCYTQEKDKLFLSIPSEGNNNFHLIISVNSQDYSLQIKDKHHKAKKNTISFFSSFFPQKVISVSIAYGDRILSINFDRGKLIIVFRGGKSNCFYESNNGMIQPFKKEEGLALESFQEELSTVKWIHHENEILPGLESISSAVNLKSLQFVSKDLVKLACNDGELSKDKIISIINSIMVDQIAVGVDTDHSIAFYQPLSSIVLDQTLELELFTSYFDANSAFMSQKVISHKEYDVKKEIERITLKELEKVTGKLNSLKTRIENGSRESEYKKYGELLLNNMKQFSKGLEEITITDWDSNQELKIKLDPKLTPQASVDYYFDKSRSEKIDFEKSKQFYESAKDKFSRLIAIKEKLAKELSLEDYNKLKKELRMDSKQIVSEDQKEKIPYRHFIIDAKYNFYIGKDSRNNDQLTTKFAKQNDFWFHARSVSGSHGVLRVDNNKEAIPKRILEKAASITAFYSKAKSSKLAPVSYTLKKYVTKNSRHEPGQVSLIKEQVLLVRPEIPNGCDYQND
jgi:predicted ribosome quality control (RQC) complex YloA/Tae2 family protein